jgi:hypothetical protein
MTPVYTPEKVLEDLAELRDRRREHERQARLLREEANQLVKAAIEGGQKKAPVARAAGLTRQTVYYLLRGNE